MLLFDILKLYDPSLQTEDCKLHLAVWNGIQKPIDVFLSGNFEEWQSWQSKKNFERKYIISLIQLSTTDKWLFAGGFISKGYYFNSSKNLYQYQTSESDAFKELTGRVVVSFCRSGRQSYLNAENWFNNISISEIKPEKMVLEQFPGYNKVILSRKQLKNIISQNIESWKAALSSVSGVYLITDTKTGKLYVGSATGENGIWQRWSEYAVNGHGGNQELKKILAQESKDYSYNFQYSVLEIADTHANSTDILNRESYWKDILCSRVHGYNAN